MKIGPIVRQYSDRVPPQLWPSLWLGMVLGFSSVTFAADQFHLLGFVEKLCADEPYCFELRIASVYTGELKERIVVRYESVNTLYDPENYELTLQQSNIIPGSHLRMLITKASNGDSYLASIIWIGD